MSPNIVALGRGDTLSGSVSALLYRPSPVAAVAAPDGPSRPPPVAESAVQPAPLPLPLAAVSWTDGVVRVVVVCTVSVGIEAASDELSVVKRWPAWTAPPLEVMSLASSDSWLFRSGLFWVVIVDDGVFDVDVSCALIVATPRASAVTVAGCGA